MQKISRNIIETTGYPELKVKHGKKTGGIYDPKIYNEISLSSADGAKVAHLTYFVEAKGGEHSLNIHYVKVHNRGGYKKLGRLLVAEAILKNSEVTCLCGSLRQSNLEIYKKNIQSGQLKEDAAVDTPLGQLSVDLGFKKINHDLSYFLDQGASLCMSRGQ